MLSGTVEFSFPLNFHSLCLSMNQPFQNGETFKLEHLSDEQLVAWDRDVATIFEAGCKGTIYHDFISHQHEDGDSGNIRVWATGPDKQELWIANWFQDELRWRIYWHKNTHDRTTALNHAIEDLTLPPDQRGKYENQRL